MAITARLILIFCIQISLFLNSSAQTCSTYTFSTNRVFSSCSDLPYLQAYLHWNYIPSTRKVQIAYRASQTSTGWIAWAINPSGMGMVGSQAIVAFRNSNGSMTVYPMPITSYNPPMEPVDLSFQVSNISLHSSPGQSHLLENRNSTNFSIPAVRLNNFRLLSAEDKSLFDTEIK